jgi:hypothetical protein
MAVDAFFYICNIRDGSSGDVRGAANRAKECWLEPRQAEMIVRRAKRIIMFRLSLKGADEHASLIRNFCLKRTQLLYSQRGKLLLINNI